MEEIIAPIKKEILLSELTPDKFLRHTRKGNNDIYIFTAKNAPNLMLEIGRLREIAFRQAGGGTGQPCDIDEYDTMDKPYYQLIVWNPEEQEIIGGYRYIIGQEVDFEEGENHPKLATSHMFNFSDKFVKDYLPYTIELGRSFVTLEYQSSKAGAKGLFALDNLWDGLGALIVLNPDMKYFFGKVTMYPAYPVAGRNMILYFLHKHFPDNDNLVYPIQPLITNIAQEKMKQLFCNENFVDDYKILNSEIRNMGYKIPPLVNAYMGLSPTMRMFGTAINDSFGDVEESGILIAFSEIHDDKRSRYIDTYEKSLNSIKR